MLAVSWTTIRLFLHVLAATIWVGGQLTLAALVPALRGLGRQVTVSAARRFNRIAWPAFAVLVATGVWNVVAESGKDHGRYRTTLAIKLVASFLGILLAG
jgi:putative copper export protein